MSTIIITGSSGLVGSESVDFFCKKGFDVIGIDNNLRSFFFGKDSSTVWIKKKLLKKHKNFKHYNVDIRNINGLKKIFKKYKKNISLVIHCAAQPSHDYEDYPLLAFLYSQLKSTLFLKFQFLQGKIKNHVILPLND